MAEQWEMGDKKGDKIKVKAKFGAHGQGKTLKWKKDT